MLNIFKRKDKAAEKFFKACDNFLEANKETQGRQIIRYLQTTSGGLTTFEAFTKLHITKLPTRISELKDKGYEFTQIWETNSDGTKRFYRYFLKSTPKQGGIKCTKCQ